jgi:hypothetical protein
MSQTLVVQLSEEAYGALRREAESKGTSPEEVAAALVECQLAARSLRAEADRQAARERFERHFGELDMGCPTGLDNDRIDADLAKECADTHEEG